MIYNYFGWGGRDKGTSFSGREGSGCEERSSLRAISGLFFRLAIILMEEILDDNLRSLIL
jgi:hypothetical protein